MWIFSAFVSSMPAYFGNNYFAKWAYAFLHAIAANLDKVHVPGSAQDVAAGVASKVKLDVTNDIVQAGK